MADINSGSTAAPHARDAYRGERKGGIASSAGDDELIALVELFFFAYRDFTGKADEVLQEFEFGRAHHRVLHFVNRRPGLRVADLLDILKITKQSLARVLKQLVDRGFIMQEAGPQDRRERHLYLTPKGKALAAKLAEQQMAQIGQALTGAGPQSEKAVREFLLAMIEPDQRASVAEAIAISSSIAEPGSLEMAPGASKPEPSRAAGPRGAK